VVAQIVNRLVLPDQKIVALRLPGTLVRRGKVERMGEYAATAAEKQRLAFTLRLAGLSWAEIAAHEYNGSPLYADVSGAHRAAQAYERSQAHGNDLMEQRSLDLHRFDALQCAMWRKAIGGDITAAKFVLKLMMAREALLELKGYVPPPSRDDPLDELSARRREA
jgi:hypothetical protein